MRFKAFSSLLAGLLLVVLACLLPDDAAHAQRKRGQTPAAQSSNDNTSAPKTSRTKRVFVGRGSDSAQGSRVTIKSDDSLNDYSAYRSGDRFYVVLPKSDASAVARGAGGRGYSDMQVQQRGNDVVLSYRVQPGTKPRVEQKFNRLDVVFDVPEGGQAAGAQAATQPPASARQPQQTPEARTPENTPPQNAGQPQQPAGERRPAATTDPATQPQQNPPMMQPGQTQPGIEPTAPPADAALMGQTPAPTPEAATTPATQEIAQVEPPKAVAPITTDTTSVQPGTTVGTYLLNNWYWVVLALAIAGIGLLFAARRSSAAAPLPPPVREEEVVATTTPLKSPRARKLKKASTAATLSTAEVAGTTETKPIIIASALTASTAVGKKEEKEEDTKEALAEEPTLVESEVVAEPVAEPVIEPVAETAAEEVTSGDAALVDEAAAVVVVAGDEKSVEPVAVETKAVAPSMSVDAEAAQAEAKRLLGGEDYDHAIVGTSDAMARQLIASELLSALAGRNADRRERARAAYVNHGYFDEVVRDLRGASAPAERASAARNLALVGDRAATPHLVAALGDRSVDVRRAAVEALATLRDPAAAEPLEALLKREKTEKTKVNRKLVQRAADVCREAAKDTPAPVIEAATIATAATEVASSPAVEAEPAATVAEAEAAATEVESTDTTPVVEAETATIEAEPAHAGLETAPAEALEETLVAEPPVEAEPAAEHEAETLVAEPHAYESIVSEPEAVSEPELVSEPETLEETAAQPVEEFAPAVEDAGVEAVSEAPAPHVEAAEPFATVESVEATQAVEVEEPTLVAEREEAADSAEAAPSEAPFEIEEPHVADFHAPIAKHEPAPLFAESAAVEPSELELEPVEQPEAVAATEATARPDAGEWVEFDMRAIEAVPEETAVEPLFEASSGEALPTAVAPFESEKAESRPSWMDESAIVERADEEAAAESVEEPVEEFAPAASSVGEKGVELFDEYSTVPTSIQPRLASSEASERAEAITELSHYDTSDAFHRICAAFDDESKDVRNAAARSLYELRADRAESFTRALRESTPERRRNIGAAISASGLASDAVSQLTGESKEKTYEAFSLLFLMAKAGEVQPLIRAIEGHPSNEVRLAVVKLLALSGQKEILPAFRRLAVRGSLPTEVRSAVMEAIYQISSGQPTPA